MKAIAVFPSQKRLDLIDFPPPSIELQDHVKLRVLEVGICGTDREIARFDYGIPPDGSDFLVMGHESLMQVVETGGAVKSVKPGDLAVLTVRRPCDQPWCAACRAGRQDFCYSGEFKERGIKGRHGYMTETVVEEERNLVPVPPWLRDVGVLIEPLTIAEKALIQLWKIQERLPWDLRHDPTEQLGFQHNALVLGAGPVALLGAMALVTLGFDTYVYSIEPATDPKAGIVKTIGGRYISLADVPIEKLNGVIERIDLVYEATGASSFSFHMLSLLGANGVFIFTGVPGRKAPVEVDTDALMRDIVLRNQIVLGTVNAGHDAFEQAVTDLQKFYRKWPEVVRSLITGRFPMESYGDLLQGNVQGIKNVFAITRQ